MISREEVMIPVVVAAEQLRGRTDAILKAEPDNLKRLQALLRKTQQVLSRFEILEIDDQSVAVFKQLRERVKTKKRYVDVLIAAQSLADNHVIVTRNVDDFRWFQPDNFRIGWMKN